jgi:archaellum component FlaC
MDSQPEDTPVTSGGGGLNPPDYEHLLNVVSDGFNKLISTFYNNNAQAVVGASLARVKETYEEIINSIVENLSQQIEGLSLENEQIIQENLMLKERNGQLEKMADS